MCHVMWPYQGWDSSVGIGTTRRGWAVQRSNPLRGKTFVSSPKHPGQLWVPTQPPIHDYGGGGLSSQGMKLTTHIHLVPSLTIGGAISLLLLCAFMTCTGSTLSLSLLSEHNRLTIKHLLLEKLMPFSWSWTAHLIHLSGTYSSSCAHKGPLRSPILSTMDPFCTFTPKTTKAYFCVTNYPAFSAIYTNHPINMNTWPMPVTLISPHKCSPEPIKKH